MMDSANELCCRGCGNKKGNIVFVAREMMYGLRNEFDYFECGKCRSLQIRELPANLEKYYPEDYLQVPPGSPTLNNRSRLYRFLLHRRTNFFLGRRTIMGALLAKMRGDSFQYDWTWLRKANVRLNSRIIDVGCGPGFLLESLIEQGFEDVYGLDRFQKDTLPRVNVYKCEMENLTEKFDFIMLHHSFEHMENPSEVLNVIAGLMSHNATVLIRIPVADCYAWRHYGVDWYQLDAPRHLFIPSKHAMNTLAKKSGLEVYDVIFDSDRTQISCSEQYQRDIPLRDAESTYHKPGSELFSAEELGVMDLQAEKLNFHRDGDQACFYLRRTSQ